MKKISTKIKRKLRNIKKLKKVNVNRYRIGKITQFSQIY